MGIIYFISHYKPGDSSRDLCIPGDGGHENRHLKGSRKLTIPKRSPAELPGSFFFWGGHPFLHVITDHVPLEVLVKG